MTWLVWRQHRAQAFGLALALAAVGVLMLTTEAHMTGAARQLGLTSCLGAHHGGCTDLANAFLARFRTLQAAGVLVLTVPALAGALIGAPVIARELEHGTQRLIWTQTITRRHWVRFKLTAIIAASALATAALSQLALWWFAPLAHAGLGRLNPLAFDVQGVAPIGYAAFAIALGAAAGAITRRTQPAMAITLAGYAGVRTAITSLARPNYETPLTRYRPVPSPGGQPTDWILSSDIVDRHGHVITTPLSLICGVPKGAAGACIRAHGFALRQIYQPAGRFGHFQTIELLIYLTLAGALAALTAWWVRQRLG